MKRYNGPLFHLVRKLWDFEDPSPYKVIEPEAEPDTPLCLNCLHPQDEHNWLCPHCAWPCGFQASQMAYINIFSLGAFFRSGVDGSVPLTKFRIAGLVLTALIHYHIFAPLYFYRLYRAKKGHAIHELSPRPNN